MYVRTKLILTLNFKNGTDREDLTTVVLSESLNFELVFLNVESTFKQCVSSLKAPHTSQQYQFKFKIRVLKRKKNSFD